MFKAFVFTYLLRDVTGLTVLVFRSRAACRAGRSRDDREGENEESLGVNSALAERPLSAGQEEKDDGGDGEEGVGIQE